VSLKKCLILTAIASFLMGNSSCQTGNAPASTWNPKIYAGDSREQVIVRGSTRIRTSSSAFDSYVCMHNSEIPKAKKAYYDLINKCEKWKPGATFIEEN